MEEKIESVETSVPYIVHEAEIARQERHIKRLFIVCLALIAVLVFSWVGFFWYESQFEDITMTQEATTDGGGDAVVNGVAEGDINYYGDEGTADNQNPQT